MTVINEPYRAGTPLKVWQADRFEHGVMAQMSISAADAVLATKKLITSAPLTDGDLAALGRANYRAFLAGFEPIFHLLSVDKIVMSEAAVSALRQHSEILEGS